MSVKLWTPIQHGRFHLRSMRPGETTRQYVSRIATPGTHKGALHRDIAPLIRMARAEAKALKRKAGKPS